MLVSLVYDFQFSKPCWLCYCLPASRLLCTRFHFSIPYSSIWYQHSFFPFFLCKNQIYSLITCALFIYPVSCIDVSENALRGMKLGQCSMAKSYPLASTYEYTKCMFLFSVFSYNSILILLLIILLQFAYCYSHMSFIDNKCTHIRMSLSCTHFSVLSLFFFQYSKTTPLPCMKYGIILFDVTQSLLCYFWY
jgi:hypothetical protein